MARHRRLRVLYRLGRADPPRHGVIADDHAHQRPQRAASEPLPHARLHGLSHVHATTLLAGVPVHVVAARLGHADPSITLRVYAHVISDQLTAAADIFARAIAGTS